MESHPQTPEQAERAKRIAKALGATHHTYIGDVFPDVLSVDPRDVQSFAREVSEIHDLPETTEG